MNSFRRGDGTTAGRRPRRFSSARARQFTWLVLSAGTSGATFSACQPDLDSLIAGDESGLVDGGSGGTAGEGSGGTGALGGNGGTGTGGTSSLGGEGGEPGSTSMTGGAGAPPDHCSDGKRDSGETDKDCGGENTCDRCELGDHCVDDSDCFFNYCAGNVCVEGNCDDGIKNQNETAVDCGGGCAPEKRCELGLGCKVDRDCISNACANGECVEHCESGKKDSDETDKDCGGSTCDPCLEDQHCKENEDCTSSVCEAGSCIGGTCDDNVVNQDESDIDCGGSCAPGKTCDINDVCNAASDCTSYVCDAGRCVPDLEIESDDIIDDMEDGDQSLPSTGGRKGTWYSFGDGTGTAIFEAALIPGQRGPDSVFAIHYSGGGFTDWGSGTGFDLNNSGGSQDTKKPYDASAYVGITFWGRSDEPFLLTVTLPDGNTDGAGGLCTTCDHHWYTRITLQPEWERHTILFENLILESGTVPEPEAPDPATLVGVQFRASTGVEFDYWIDDVAFVRP